MNMNEDVELELFKVVKTYIFNVGGDGDGYIVSQRYIELANRFEEIEKETDQWLIERRDRDGVISLGVGQEYILFVKDRSYLPEPFIHMGRQYPSADIIVEIM